MLALFADPWDHPRLRHKNRTPRLKRQRSRGPDGIGLPVIRSQAARPAARPPTAGKAAASDKGEATPGAAGPSASGRAGAAGTPARCGGHPETRTLPARAMPTARRLVCPSLRKRGPRPKRAPGTPKSCSLSFEESFFQVAILALFPHGVEASWAALPCYNSYPQTWFYFVFAVFMDIMF